MGAKLGEGMGTMESHPRHSDIKPTDAQPFYYISTLPNMGKILSTEIQFKPSVVKNE